MPPKTITAQQALQQILSDDSQEEMDGSNYGNSSDFSPESDMDESSASSDNNAGPAPVAQVPVHAGAGIAVPAAPVPVCWSCWCSSRWSSRWRPSSRCWYSE